MNDIELYFLGRFEVVNHGEPMPLPPSKKTRALLAYLSLNPRPMRREFLCELLWDIPDDPRGSLRWSLSKLRRLVNDADIDRIVADRNTVELDRSGVRIDVLQLSEIVTRDLGSTPTAALEDAAHRFQGNLLEDLELSNFYDFHSWCISEREQVVRHQEILLLELLDRLHGEPERAIPFARTLVSLSPYDEDNRAALIRLLVDLKHYKEAEQQFHLGRKMLAEVKATPTGAMLEALRRHETSAAKTESAPSIESTASTPTFDSPTDKAHETAEGIVGRSREMLLLSGVFTDVYQDNVVRFALISGEPGIGKTRLIQAVAEMARQAGANILESSAYESEGIRPFALWVDALGGAGGNIVADIFNARDGTNRGYLFDSLSSYIDAESTKGPMVLVFDDIHWCDESSAAALHYIARMNRHRPLLVVLGAREGELRDNLPVQQVLRGLSHDGVLTEVRLGPLTEIEIEQLVQQIEPRADRGKLSQECGGNPLFAIELARAEQAREGGNTFNELIRDRLSRLDIEGGEVLRWAAVLSPHIDFARLEKLTGFDSDQIGAVLEAAERQAMMKTTREGLRFSHNLIARGVYNDISPVRRQVMHRRVAELLEQSIRTDLGQAADLAHHATQSGDAALAARALVKAGQLCLRFFANEEALSLARRGLEIVDSLGESERVCVTIDLHNVRLSAAPLDDWESAARQYAELAERALDYGHLPHARLGYQMAANVRWAHGQWGGAREESLQAERIARGSTEEEHIIGLAETGKCLAMLERDLSHADAMLMQANAMAERRHFNYYAIPTGSGMLRFHENSLDEAEELFKDARTLCKSAGDRVSEFQANEYLVMIDIQRGSYKQAGERCLELKRIGEKLPEGSEAPFAHSLAGLCVYAESDDFDPLDRALESLRIADAKFRLAYAQTRAALLDIEFGRFETAIERATEALSCATVLERPTETLLANAVLANAHRQLGDTGKAEKYASLVAGFESARVAVWAQKIALGLTELTETK